MIFIAMLIMLAFMQAVGLFAFMRGIYLYPAPNLIKVILAVIIEIGVFNLTIMLLFCRYFPTWLNMLFGFSGISMIYLAITTLFMEILRLLKCDNPKVYFCLIIISLILSTTAYIRSFSQPTIKSIDIPSNKFTKDCKIVQISDMHTGPVLKRDWVEKTIEKINAIKPDLVVITGDSLDSSVENGLNNLLPLKNINAPTYMIMGNHEYYNNAPEWIKKFKEMGIKILINSHVIIDNNFALGGADWIHNYINDSEHLISKTFNGTPDNMPKILLSHYPKSFTEAKNEGVLLQLSGHTHGGQTFPANIFVTMANGGYLRGLYTEINKYGETSYLYVNDGTGIWAGMPARLGSSNEITIINLKKTK